MTDFTDNECTSFLARFSGASSRRSPKESLDTEPSKVELSALAFGSLFVHYFRALRARGALGQPLSLEKHWSTKIFL